MSYAATLYYLFRDHRNVQSQTQESIALATEAGIAQWVEHGLILQAYCMAESGKRENVIDQLWHSFNVFQNTGASIGKPYYMALLAKAYEMADLADEGLAMVQEALNTAHETGERWFQAELYRFKGEILLKLSTPEISQAEAAFQQALTIAQHQQSKSWELRAAMSLSRLWQQQGNRHAAHALLAPVYEWFTEGFDTPDLQDAQALLQELDHA
jgi:predicted ATPase